ncbi:MAG TPA: PH domain-containing protein [Polyangiaceae bacterium]
MSLQVFEVPSTGGHTWLTALMLLPVVIGLALALAFWPRALNVEVTHEAVTVRGSVYGRRVPRSQLRLSEARIVNLADEPALRPRLRTNGVGLPNYRVGWFRLSDRERALCFLTTTDSVLYLPTTENYSLLISTSDPTGLLHSLKGDI